MTGSYRMRLYVLCHFERSDKSILLFDDLICMTDISEG